MATSSYYAADAGRESPVANLVPPRREGIARMLLPTAVYDRPVQFTVESCESTQAGDAFGTIVILTETTTPAKLLKLVRACLNGAVGRRRAGSLES